VLFHNLTIPTPSDFKHAVTKFFFTPDFVVTETAFEPPNSAIAFKNEKVCADADAESVEEKTVMADNLRYDSLDERINDSYVLYFLIMLKIFRV